MDNWKILPVLGLLTAALMLSVLVMRRTIIIARMGLKKIEPPKPAHSVPGTLDEAVDFLKKRYAHDAISCKSENEFLGKTHHFLGRWMRNTWNLWWTKKGAEKWTNWPREKPELVKYFNDKGIYHADDMSGIILKSFYRSMHGQPWREEREIDHYKRYWASKGIDIKAESEK